MHFQNSLIIRWYSCRTTILLKESFFMGICICLSCLFSFLVYFWIFPCRQVLWDPVAYGRLLCLVIDPRWGDASTISPPLYGPWPLCFIWAHKLLQGDSFQLISLSISTFFWKHQISHKNTLTSCLCDICWDMVDTRIDFSSGFSFTIIHSLLMAASHPGPKNVALCWEVLVGDEERGNGLWSRCLSSHCA